MNSLIRNALLFFVLSCIMPETRALDSASIGGQVCWILYQLAVPVCVALGFCVIGCLSSSSNDKEVKEVQVALLVPVLSFLLSESLETSGLLSLLVCGTFMSLYTNPSQSVQTAILFCSHLSKQIGCLLLGVITPFYICNADENI